MPTKEGKLKKLYKKLAVTLQKRSMVSFLTALVILLIAIILSKLVFAPKIQPEKKITIVKEVKTYQVGSAPKLVFQGQVKKTGVIKLFSQTAGVVQNINVSEGQKVAKGANLLNLSTNYQGDNAAGVQTAISSRQYQQVTDTFNTQQDLISKQRDLANKVRDNATNLATISAQSHGETQSLIDLNQNILNTLTTNLTNLQNNNPGGINDQTILQIQGQISQLLSGQIQLKSALRNLDYSTSSNNPPSELSDLQRDITQKQLDLQQKSLEMNRDISKLQLSLASIMASFYHPIAPVAGSVERVLVRPLQIVNPGTPLLTIVGDNKDMQLVITLSEGEARKISAIETATIHFNGKQVNLVPSFISTEATDSQLYSVVFNLPEENYNLVADGDYVSVDLPLGTPATFGTYFVPLDAVVQTQEQSSVYVVDHGKVASRKVVIGPVSGQFAQIASGLTGGEEIILNRNVVAGDYVKTL